MERAEEALAHMGSSVSYILKPTGFTTGSEVSKLTCWIVKNIWHAGYKNKSQGVHKNNKFYTSAANVNLFCSFIRLYLTLLSLCRVQ